MFRGLHIDDQVVLVQPPLRRLDHGWTKMLQARTQQVFRGLLHFRRVHPAIGMLRQGVEMTLEGSDQLDAGDSEPVILDPAVQLFAGGKHDSAGRLDNGRGLRLGIVRRAMDETRRAGSRLRPEQSRQFFQLKRFANVEQAKDAEVALSIHGARTRILS